jgi:hypothetical protein
MVWNRPGQALADSRAGPPNGRRPYPSSRAIGEGFESATATKPGSEAFLSDNSLTVAWSDVRASIELERAMRDYQRTKGVK